MIVYNNANPRGKDMGPRHWHGSEVSVLARLDIARPMPDGFSWRDTTAAWLRSSRPPGESRPRPPRLAVMLECQGCGEAFRAINGTQAIYCGSRCRKRASRARRAA